MTERMLPEGGATLEQFARLAAADEFTAFQCADQIIDAIRKIPDEQLIAGLQNGVIEHKGWSLSFQFKAPFSTERPPSPAQFRAMLERGLPTRLHRRWLEKSSELLRSGRFHIKGIPEGRSDRIGIDRGLVSRAGWRSYREFEQSTLVAAGRIFDCVLVFDLEEIFEANAVQQLQKVAVDAKRRADCKPRGSRFPTIEANAARDHLSKIIQEAMLSSPKTALFGIADCKRKYWDSSWKPGKVIRKGCIPYLEGRKVSEAYHAAWTAVGLPPIWQPTRGRYNRTDEEEARVRAKSKFHQKKPTR